MNSSKRKLNLLDEIAQIDDTRDQNRRKSINNPKPEKNTQPEWFDALNGEDNTHIGN